MQQIVLSKEMKDYDAVLEKTEKALKQINQIIEWYHVEHKKMKMEISRLKAQKK